MKRKISVLPLAIIAILLFVLNWYVLSGIRTISSNSVTTPLFWGFIAITTAALIYSIIRMRDNGMDLLFKITTHVFLILFVTEVIFSAFLLLGDIY